MVDALMAEAEKLKQIQPNGEAPVRWSKEIDDAVFKCEGLQRSHERLGVLGAEAQLGGMGTAFSSSLLGLAGSLIVGLLELFAGHG